MIGSAPPRQGVATEDLAALRRQRRRPELSRCDALFEGPDDDPDCSGRAPPPAQGARRQSRRQRGPLPGLQVRRLVASLDRLLRLRYRRSAGGGRICHPMPASARSGFVPKSSQRSSECCSAGSTSASSPQAWAITRLDLRPGRLAELAATCRAAPGLFGHICDATRAGHGRALPLPAGAAGIPARRTGPTGPPRVHACATSSSDARRSTGSARQLRCAPSGMRSAMTAATHT